MGVCGCLKKIPILTESAACSHGPAAAVRLTYPRTPRDGGGETVV
jgi:hypothetical protein